MQQASNKLLQELKERGYRVTGARREVLRVLLSAKEPLSILEISQRASADEASVYRIIKLLSKEQLISPLTAENERPRYELNEHHHHHAICRSCGRVAHVGGGAEPQSPRRIPGFVSITGHELTFYGLCSRCV